MEYQYKGCGESCLKRLCFQMGTAQLQPRGQARVMLGCSSLTSLQGLQNTNTPAPHSTLVWFFDFFFYLKFLIFDIGINNYIRKQILMNHGWQSLSR